MPSERDKMAVLIYFCTMWKLQLASRVSKYFQLFFSFFPTTATHNLEKFKALRIIFHNLALDRIEGPYVEFGVAHGNSLYGALLANSKTSFKPLGINLIGRRFIGFDTFEQFTSTLPEDNHSVWSGNKFSATFESVTRRFRKYQNVSLYKIDATLLEDNSNSGTHVDSVIHEEMVAVVLFDMDLMGPTYSALNWIEPKINLGTILIFDEYFGFRGDSTLGEAGAFSQFLTKHKNLEVRELLKYGSGGVVFQVSQSR